MIEVRDLTKRYGPNAAVDWPSFTVPPGTVTGFLGPNGAGKSTTMWMIAGLDQSAARRVRSSVTVRSPKASRLRDVLPGLNTGSVIWGGAHNVSRALSPWTGLGAAAWRLRRSGA